MEYSVSIYKRGFKNSLKHELFSKLWYNFQEKLLLWHSWPSFFEQWRKRIDTLSSNLLISLGDVSAEIVESGTDILNTTSDSDMKEKLFLNWKSWELFLNLLAHSRKLDNYVFSEWLGALVNAIDLFLDANLKNSIHFVIFNVYFDRYYT